VRHTDNVTGAGLERVRRAVRQVLCRLPVPATLLLLAACTPPADFEAARQPLVPGAYLDIKPLDEVLAVGGKPALTETDTAALQSRAAALQARAAALPATATDPETRARLDAAIIANSP
jgi:hypothetical protein